MNKLNYKNDLTTKFLDETGTVLKEGSSVYDLLLASDVPSSIKNELLCFLSGVESAIIGMVTTDHYATVAAISNNSDRFQKGSNKVVEIFQEYCAYIPVENYITITGKEFNGSKMNGGLDTYTGDE